MRALKSSWAAIAAVVALAPAPATAHNQGPHRAHSAGIITYSIEPGDGPPSVALVSGDGGTSRFLTLPVDGAVVPRLSPNGHRLVTATFSDAGLRPATVRPDGTGFKLLRVPSLPANTDISPCTWATNRRLLCSVNNATGSLGGVYSLSSTDRGRAQRLTSSPFPPGPDFGGGDTVGDVSPDRTEFVFMRAKPSPPPDHPERDQSGALFIGHLDGSHVRRITPFGVPNSHDIGVESWSPDGRRILFATEEGQLKTIHPDGSELRPLTLQVSDDSFAYAPAWSPSGSRIAFGLARGSDGQADIYTANSSGDHVKQITNTGTFDDFPDWGTLRQR